MKRVVLYGNFTDSMKACLRRECSDDFLLEYVSATDSLHKLENADYMINRACPITPETIAAAKNLKLIHKWGVGYDKIDIAEAGKAGIPVTVTVGGNSMPVAELAVALMLTTLRAVVPMALAMKEGMWTREQYAGRAYLLNGKTVGLIGIGNIAKKVAHILNAGFSCKVIYYDVSKLAPEQEKEMSVEYKDLNDLITTSDIVSIHVPLNSATSGLLNAEKFGLMKSSSIVINTARGGIINEDDLVEALKSGKILGAGLDTFAQEPLSKNSPLLRMDNVVTTPHCGGNTIDNDSNMAKICMDIIKRYDKQPNNSMREIVNRQFL